MVKDIKHKPIPGGGRKSILEHFRKTDKGFDVSSFLLCLWPSAGGDELTSAVQISIDLLRDDRDNEREGTSAERRNDHIAVFRQLAYSARCRERDQTGPAAVGGDPIFHFAEEDPYGCCIAWQSDIWVGLANDYRVSRVHSQKVEMSVWRLTTLFELSMFVGLVEEMATSQYHPLRDTLPSRQQDSKGAFREWRRTVEVFCAHWKRSADVLSDGDHACSPCQRAGD